MKWLIHEIVGKTRLKLPDGFARRLRLRRLTPNLGMVARERISLPLMVLVEPRDLNRKSGAPIGVIETYLSQKDLLTYSYFRGNQSSRASHPDFS